MTKKQLKESKELAERIWKKAESLRKAGKDFTGADEVVCEITYVDDENDTVTESTKYVRWDGAIVTESGEFVWYDMNRIVAVQF